MKNKIVYTLLLLSLACLTSCSSNALSNNDDKTKITTQDTTQTTAKTKDETPLTTPEYTPDSVEDPNVNYPENIKSTYDNFNNCINANFQNFSLDQVVESRTGNSTFYKFQIITGARSVEPEITIQNSSTNLRVSLPDTVENEQIKDIILCALMSVNSKLTIEDATELTQNLVNSFDGNSNSTILENGNYVCYISPASGLIMRYLNFIDKDNINTAVDTSVYDEPSLDMFTAELNVGYKCFIEGEIINNVDLGNGSYGLEVIYEGNTYVVYYNFDNFPNYFVSGQKGRFYGTIAQYRNGYSGCIILDYYEPTP